ncbi:MAG: DMT family transporter [Pseudomonadales bacterium]
MDSTFRATAYACAAVFLWSTVATAFKLSLQWLTPIQLVLGASLVSLAFLTLWLLVNGRLRKALTVSRQHWLRSAVLGALNPFLYYLVLFEAYDRLPAQVAQPLNYTWAITMSLLAVPLLGQRLSLREILGLLISYSGVVVISTQGLSFDEFAYDPIGIALALGSTLLWSLYWIYSTRDEREPADALFLNFLLGTPWVLILCLSTSGLPQLSLPALAGIAWVGLFEMGLTFVLWLYAMRLAVNAARVSQLIFLSPFLSLFLIQYVLGEDIHRATIAGLILVVAGLLARGPARNA